MIFSERGGTWAAEVPCNQVRNCITRSFHAAAAAAAATCMAERADRNNDHLWSRARGECVICKLMTWLVSALGRLSLGSYVILLQPHFPAAQVHTRARQSLGK